MAAERPETIPHSTRKPSVLSEFLSPEYQLPPYSWDVHGGPTIQDPTSYHPSIAATNRLQFQYAEVHRVWSVDCRQYRLHHPSGDPSRPED